MPRPRLLLAVLIVWPTMLFAEQSPANARFLRCRPRVLYSGDTLTIDLATPHVDYEFAIWADELRLMMISFKPGPKDSIGPIVAPDVFRTMKRIELLTTSAQGYPSHFWHGSDVPHAAGSPKLIFTNAGLYEVLLGPAIGAEDADFDGCWVDYIDRPRPQSRHLVSKHKPQAEQPRHSTGEVADVGSTAMSSDQIRALRRAAERQGVLMIQEGDHFHLQF